MKIKNMAASGLSGRIFYGTMETKDGGQSGKWLAGKQDVTDMAIRAVAEHCHLTGNEYSFTLNDGRVITLAVTEVQPS
ncbi:hypothetical protein G6K62_003858 [Salmonella enterica subsp. enterica serovar Rubislaw]|nr:hypothetical protein [Salmonella enterica]EEO8518008.1 hypothetical protein [Salmonella enterica subsp. enterica serovar Rubislaw]UAW58886.1 polyphosphate hydrolase [Escherichia phage vB_EcoS_AVIO78A]